MSKYDENVHKIRGIIRRETGYHPLTLEEAFRLGYKIGTDPDVYDNCVWREVEKAFEMYIEERKVIERLKT